MTTLAIVTSTAARHSGVVSETPFEVARAAALDAGNFIRRAAATSRVVELKSAVDLVTQVDRTAESMILERIARAFPDHTFVAEESAPAATAGSKPCWYVDPLDGTTNFVHGVPHCAVSIAMSEPPSGAMAAIVYDPFKDELFAARRGEGATLNGRHISVSSARTLEQSLFVTGFPYDRRLHAGFYLRYFEAFLLHCRDLRRFGSAALDLSYVACGRFDGFWEWGLKPWDTAAGELILEEAGGRVTDFDGGRHDPWIPRILATNGATHEEAIALLGTLPLEP
jgi:myo-inositol-1(or 4)-monophosphatase